MADNSIAFGLCKQYGIKLPENPTPNDAWEALKNHGVVIGDDNGKLGSIIPGKGSQHELSVQISKQEWAVWYKIIGDEKHGDYVFNSCGKKFVPINNKIFCSSGSFEKPILDYVIVFENEHKATQEYMIIREVYDERN